MGRDKKHRGGPVENKSLTRKQAKKKKEKKEPTSALNNTVNKLILDRGSCEKFRFADPVFILLRYRYVRPQRVCFSAVLYASLDMGIFLNVEATFSLLYIEKEINKSPSQNMSSELGIQLKRRYETGF